MVKAKATNCIQDYKNCPIGIMMNDKIDQINNTLSDINTKLQRIDTCLQKDRDFRIINEPIIKDLKITVNEHSQFILSLQTTLRNFRVLIIVFFPSGIYSLLELIKFFKDILT